MKLTPEQIAENLACYKQVMETGSIEGLQVMHRGAWIDKESNTFHVPEIYRRKHTPTLRPWKPEEVPLGGWIRVKGYADRFHLLTYSGPDGIAAGIQCEERKFQNLTGDAKFALQHWEHSLDNGRTWLPCGVEEGR